MIKERKPGAPWDPPASDQRESAHVVDRHVGLRIKMRRKEIGVSQDRLAGLLGITFQQVQKYERGINRVSASKLWEIAAALNVSIGYFFDGLGGDDHIPSGHETSKFLLSGEGLELMTSFPRIASPSARRKLLELVRALAENS